MIFGIGTDIVDVRRFEKWLQNEELLERYFNEAELFYVQPVVLNS